MQGAGQLSSGDRVFDGLMESSCYLEVIRWAKPKESISV